MAYRDFFTNLTPTPAPRPKPTLAKRKQQAAKALKLYREGVRATLALKQAGLNPCMARALRECAAGEGPLVDFVKAGKSPSELPPSVPSTCLSFIRWVLDLPPINGVKDDDNRFLRLALKNEIKGTTWASLARATGLSRSTLRRFTSGEYPRMRAANRARVWAVFT